MDSSSERGGGVLGDRAPPGRRPLQIVRPRQPLGEWAIDLWRFRAVLWALCARDLRGKYKQAALGVAWALIQPLVQVGLFTLVFRGVARVETPVPYPVFVLASLLPFNLFSQLVSLGAPAFVQAQGILTKVYFPRFFTVIAGGVSAWVNAAIGAALLAVAFGWAGLRPTAGLALALPLLAAMALLGLGVAALLAALNARFRDVQHALPLLMTVLLYASPVLYPLGSLPDRMRLVALANPVTGLVDGFRAVVTGADPYSWPLVFGDVGIAVALFFIGTWAFERHQARLVDLL